MTTAFGSPSSYVQGKGVLNHADEHLHVFGHQPLVLAGGAAYRLVGEDLILYLQEHDYQPVYVPFNGESSDNEINRVAQIGRDEEVTVIYGLGGGKTVDTAKAIADQLNLPVVIMPTLASNDAPCSRLSVIYTDDGGFDHYLFYQHNPELVLVDTDVIAKAPVRMLISGIADALATNVEAESVAQANADTMLNQKQTLVGGAIAKQCEATLFKYAHQAVAACEGNVVTPALEKIVEANTLMSGLGFESGGLSGIHSIHDGLTILPATHEFTHGEKVAYGTLTQLMLEGADEARYNKYLDFIKSLGLPTTLADLNLADVAYADLLKAGEAACSENDTMDRLPFEVTPADVADALIAVDAYSKQYFAK